MKKNSVKNIRINSEVQREMSQIIREDIKDPRVHPLTSVMAVEVTPDLKFAKIFISVFGNEEEKDDGRLEKERSICPHAAGKTHESSKYTGIDIYIGRIH